MKLKNILIITIAIVTLGLVVACSDDVVVTNKDNNQDYTQVLTSNGAFEYNGTKYDTLQLALKAIADGKGTSDVKTIKVLRDVTGPGASISADKVIVLDLDGHTLTFIDVEKEALTAGGSVNLTVKNGTLAFFKDSAKTSLDYDRTLILSQGANSLSLEGVTLNAAGQNAVVAVGTSVVVKGGSVLSGDVLANGGLLSITGNSTLDGALDADDSHVSLGTGDSDTSKITGEINLKGSAANNTSFASSKGTSVTGKITAVGAEKAGTYDNSFVKLSIANTVDGVYMQNGAIYVEETGHATMLNVDTSADPAVSGNWYKAANGTTAITVPEGSQVTVDQVICQVQYGEGGPITYYGSVAEALSDTVNEGRTIKMLSDDILGVDKELGVSYSVTIDLAGKNMQYGIVAVSGAPVSGAVLTLAKGVTLTVKNTSSDAAHLGHKIKSATEGTSSLVTYSETTGNLVLEGDIDITGNLTDGAGDGSSTGPYKNGSTFKGQITVAGTATFKASTINNGINTVSAKEVTINKGTVTTYGIANGTETVEEKKWYKPSDKITIDKGSTITVSGLVGKDVTINKTSINAGATPYAVICGKLHIEDNTPVTKPSDVVLITDSTGYIYLIDAGTERTGENIAVTVSNGSAGGNLAISTIKSDYDVVLAGPDTTYDLTVGGVTSANLIAGYTTFNGNIIAKNRIVAANSTFDTLNALDVKGTEDPEDDTPKQVSGKTLNITSSTFTATTSGSASNFYALEASGEDYTDPADSTKTVSALLITTSTGTVDSLAANGGGSINIANGSATAALTVTGDVKASKTEDTTTTYYDVTLIGASDHKVVVNGSIYGNSVEATDVTLDSLDVPGKKVSGSTLSFTTSVFKATTTDTPSKFHSLEASGADPDEDTSALKITTSIGTVASLKTTSGSINVANGSASAALTVTGNVTAYKTVEETTTYYDVTLVGNANTTAPETVKNVVVNGAISGNDVDITYASVNGVAANTSGQDAGDFTSKNSNVRTVNASGTVTDGTFSGTSYSDGSTFHENIQAAGNLTFYSSVFCNDCKPSITSYAGGNILIVQATGTTKDITTNAPTSGATAEASGTITINNGGLAFDITLTTGALSATYNDLRGDVTVTGQGSLYLTVTGSVTGDDIAATGCTFNATTDKTISGKTLSITASKFDSTTAEYALTASGADYGTPSTSALKITNTTGKVVSLTATAGSIDVDNHGTSGILTVDGSVSATSASTDAKVKIVGATETRNVVVNGSVSAKTSFSAENAVVGNDKTDLTGDFVYSPAIEISNSKIVLNRIAASATASADALTITSPVEGSAVANIATDKLDVTAEDTNLVVDNVSITGTSTNNTIAGGTYKALTFKGTGVVSSTLTISKGLFRESETEAGDFDFITGTTWIAGKYTSSTSEYTVYMWGLDSLNSNTSIECAYIQSSKLSNLPNIVARVNQTSSNQKVYINYNPYYESTSTTEYRYVEIDSGAPEYNFSTNGGVYDVVMNFDYAPTTTSGYTLNSGLYVTDTARPTFKFGNNNISVTGRIFVTGEATLYSTLENANFVFLATDPDSVTHEWIVALPAEADGNLFKYKAASVTLDAHEVLAAKNRILVGDSTVGIKDTNNTGWGWYYDGKNVTTGTTIYTSERVKYFKADYNNDGYITYAPAMETMQSWESGSLDMLWNMVGGGSHIIWSCTKHLSTSNYYGYRNGWITSAPGSSSEYFNYYYVGEFTN